MYSKNLYYKSLLPYIDKEEFVIMIGNPYSIFVFLKRNNVVLSNFYKFKLDSVSRILDNNVVLGAVKYAKTETSRYNYLVIDPAKVREETLNDFVVSYISFKNKTIYLVVNK